VLLLVNESSSDDRSCDTDDSSFLSGTDDNERLLEKFAKSERKVASQKVPDPHMTLRSAMKARCHWKEKHDLSDTDSEDEDGA
jgi:hypothetical protein